MHGTLNIRHCNKYYTMQFNFTYSICFDQLRTWKIGAFPLIVRADRDLAPHLMPLKEHMAHHQISCCYDYTSKHYWKSDPMNSKRKQISKLIEKKRLSRIVRFLLT